ncbi:MAG: hypothetical protein L0216_08795 [Planctomycetales bacterium]|nr:hypothetical protein [Planctomycetales bacterium]
MRSPERLRRYREMTPAEKAEEFRLLERAARVVWDALPEEERRRRRERARAERAVTHRKLLERLGAADREASQR